MGLESYTIVGATAFWASSSTDYHFYNCQFGTLSNSTYGLIMEGPPSDSNISYYGMTYEITYFYMEFSQCPNSSYYLDTTPVTGNCFDCTTLKNCTSCKSTSICF